jgi:hypothetical protein
MPSAADSVAAAHSLLSSKDYPLYPPANGTAEIRFLPDGAFFAFDRALVLSAGPGESRTYLVQIATDKNAEGQAPILKYVIDKRRPKAPRCEPGTGLYSEALRPALSSDAGASVFWALVAPSGAAPDFVEYHDDARPSLVPPAAGTATYSLFAYAVDSAGNRSYPARYVFRLAEPGLQAAAPVADSWVVSSDPSLNKPDIDLQRGFALIRAKLPEDASLLLDLAPGSPPDALDDFEQVASQGGEAFLRLPCPYGWAGSILFYHGILKDGVASYDPQPMSVQLSNPVDESSLPPMPEGPSLAADPNGRGAFVMFPSYDGSLYVSVNDGDPFPYAAPVPISKGKRSVKIAWYGEDNAGLRTATKETSFALPEALPDVELLGIADGASTSKDVTLKSSAKAVLRYEISLDGSLPPEPSISSPLFGETMPLSCPLGEERAVVIRYRAFSGDKGGEGRILRFFLDKKPPEPPLPVDLVSTITDRPLSLRLDPGSGGKAVFASVSVDGAPASFAPISGPIDLPGSETGPVSYLVNAYDLDAAGNRSRDMKALAITVDRSAVYAADDGASDGDGSPDRPFKSLDAAVAAAIAGGRRNIDMRGALEMRTTALIGTDLGLVGGFDGQWGKDASAKAILRVRVPRSGPAFVANGCSLAFKRLDLRAELAGPSPVISVVDGILDVENSSLAVSSEGDLLLASAQRAKIDIRDTRITASKGMSCTLFSADSSDISLTSCSISASRGVRIFGAFDMDGGLLSIGESLVESEADLGLKLLSLRSASLKVDRSLFRAEGGSGFLRLGSFASVKGEIRNSKILLSWHALGTLFEMRGGGPAFRFDTIIGDTEQGGLRFFDAQGGSPEIWDCILDCSGKGSELLRCDSSPGPGALVADCLFGFDLLLSGAIESRDLAALNALNAASVLYSSRPNISEPPDRSFAAPLKSLAPLRPDSACVGAALPIEGYDIDFNGRSRPGPGKRGPDIGADELVN